MSRKLPRKVSIWSISFLYFLNISRNTFEVKLDNEIVYVFVTEDSSKSVDVVGTGGASGPSRLSASSSSSSDSDSSSSSLSSSSTDSSDSEAG